MSNILILIYYGFLIILLYVIVHVLIVTNCCNVTKQNTVSRSPRRAEHRVIRCIRIDPSNPINNILRVVESGADAQGNVFTIHDPNNYHDIYCVASNPAHLQAAALAQREKDEKDLPTYEEVMRLSQYTTDARTTSVIAAISATSCAPTTTPSTDSLSDLFIGVPSTEPAPPYDEVILNTNSKEMLDDNIPSCSRSTSRTTPITISNCMNDNSSSIAVSKLNTQITITTTTTATSGTATASYSV